MKRLSIMRHAKSDWSGVALDDFDRPLNDRGWKTARRMGKELVHRAIRFDLVIASPAARVRETIDGLTEKLELKAEIRFEPRMYSASGQTLLEIVRNLPEGAHAPLLVGHNPGMQQLIVELTHGDRHARRHRVAEKFPTAALAQLELPAHRWSDVARGSGEIAELILPKGLD